MKRSRFSDEEKIGILREADSGRKVKDLCDDRNSSEATFGIRS